MLTSFFLIGLASIFIYYPVDISTTVFSYSHAVQYHTILHGAGVIARVLLHGPGAMRYPGKQVARMRIRIA